MADGTIYTVMSELLFESFSAPSVAYGVDSLLSLYSVSPSPTTADALVISSGTSSTSVIPMLGGKSRLDAAKKYVPSCCLLINQTSTC